MGYAIAERSLIEDTGATGAKTPEAAIAKPAAETQVEHYHVFETAAGPCGIAWCADGLTRLQLPEKSRHETEARLASRLGAVMAERVPVEFAKVVTALQRYFAGRPIDFADVAVDLSGAAPFHRKIYEATRRLRWGETATYGELASAAGSPGAARAVGQAMAKNPVPVIIPCHRVLAGGRKIGGFSAPGGTSTKERLLAMEGVELGGDVPLLEWGKR